MDEDIAAQPRAEEERLTEAEKNARLQKQLEVCRIFPQIHLLYILSTILKQFFNMTVVYAPDALIYCTVGYYLVV